LAAEVLQWTVLRCRFALAHPGRRHQLGRRITSHVIMTTKKTCLIAREASNLRRRCPPHPDDAAAQRLKKDGAAGISSGAKEEAVQNATAGITTAGRSGLCAISGTISRS